MTLYIGLMSGTSMDGIDAALVNVETHQLLYGITKKYSDEIQKRLRHLIDGQNLSLAALCELDTLIGREFAKTVEELLLQTKVSQKEIEAIGSHGQTVCHKANTDIPYTLQLGCAHTIASLTGIKVVADFRTRDLVNGGQGAPFAPLYHQELFKSSAPIAVVNVGGIANNTFIAPGKPTQGWDIGPGNCLIDAWIQQHQDKAFDEGGYWAQQGIIIEPLLRQLLKDPFFALSAPKSIGKEYFSLAWLEPYLSSSYAPVDVQATLLALTAHLIADCVQAQKAVTLYLCGGGVHNGQLHHLLRNLIPHVEVLSTADVGISPDYLEAMMFAWLGAQAVNKKMLDLCSITGAKQPELLGVIYP